MIDYSPIIYFGRLLLKELAQVDQAAKFYNILLKSSSPDHPNISFVYNGLGNVHEKRDEQYLTLKNYEIAYMIRREQLPPPNYDLTYKEKGDLDVAFNHLFLALEMFQRVLSSQHTNIAWCLDLNEALKNYEEALSIFEQSIPVDHQAVANCLTTMGNLHSIIDSPDSALQCHLKALDLYRQTPLTYWYMNNPTETFRYLNESLSNYQTSCGPENEADIAKLNAEQKKAMHVEPVQDNLNEEQCTSINLHSDSFSSFAK
ncbi:unnamed protein product [Rotaria sp. Silwood1]|nr:unnamed protein product [Rotaria sp. Silwood1]